MSTHTKSFHDQAHTIKKNAEEVIESLKINEILKQYGTLFFTGSYALDLMTWNDIDMQLVIKEGVNTKKAFNEIFSHFFQNKAFIKSKVIHFHGDFKPVMPRGLYLGLEFSLQELGGMWKLDLWVLEQEDFDKNRTFIKDIESILTPKIRGLILEMKHEMMSGNSRVPQLGSYELYKALLKGYRSKDEINKYLKSKNVR
tara:strand:+ start:4361 stop:4957 length:597 start_codon:yes stop_codon:yes gene_type:complete